MFTAYADAAAELARRGTAPADPLTMPIADARVQQARYFAYFNQAAASVHREETIAVAGPYGDIPIRLAVPTDAREFGCIVFIRGAGFWAGSLDSHRNTVNALARLSGCAVCAIDYRRTPEFAYPVQRDEVLTVLAWLRARGAAYGLRDGEPVLFGESAGATIAVSVAQALRNARMPLPAGLVLFYPNAAGPRASARSYSQWVWQQYIGNADPSAIPGPVPMRESMCGLPPAWLGCGDADPLLADTLQLAERFAADGVPHTVTRYAGMPHAFVMFSATLQPARDALADAAHAARRFLELVPA